MLCGHDRFGKEHIVKNCKNPKRKEDDKQKNDEEKHDEDDNEE